LALAGSDAAVSVILNLQRLPAHLRRDQKMSGPYDTTLWCLHGPGVRTPTATVDVKAGDCVRIRRHLLREPTRRPCTRCACRLVDGTEPSLTRRAASLRRRLGNRRGAETDNRRGPPWAAAGKMCRKGTGQLVDCLKDQTSQPRQAPHHRVHGLARHGAFSQPLSVHLVTSGVGFS